MDELLQTLLSLLDEPGVRVRIIEIRIPGQKKNTEPESPASPLAQFGSMEKAILSAATHDWKPAPVLAHDCSEEETTKFRITLANLVDRGILESSSRGYRIAPHIDLGELAKMI